MDEDKSMMNDERGTLRNTDEILNQGSGFTMQDV